MRGISLQKYLIIREKKAKICKKFFRNPKILTNLLAILKLLKSLKCSIGYGFFTKSWWKFRRCIKNMLNSARTLVMLSKYGRDKEVERQDANIEVAALGIFGYHSYYQHMLLTFSIPSSVIEMHRSEPIDLGTRGQMGHLPICSFKRCPQKEVPLF